MSHVTHSPYVPYSSHGSGMAAAAHSHSHSHNAIHNHGHTTRSSLLSSSAVNHNVQNHHSNPSTRMSLAGWWRQATPSCSPSELTQIIVAPSHGYYQLPTDPYNEVYDGIYIGDGTTAMCTALLRRLGITHVLNAAKGKDESRCFVNTSQKLRDQIFGNRSHRHDIIPSLPHFEQGAQFIEDALRQNGKVLVHCRQGISRSATLVIAFLMIKRGMSAQEAVRRVRHRREVIPNEGFLKQLCVLNEILLQAKRSSMRNPFDRPARAASQITTY